jgi:hypothetical protein
MLNNREQPNEPPASLDQTVFLPSSAPSGILTAFELLWVLLL